jgi:quinol monooxygenase YgiN
MLPRTIELEPIGRPQSCCVNLSLKPANAEQFFSYRADPTQTHIPADVMEHEKDRASGKGKGADLQGAPNPLATFESCAFKSVARTKEDVDKTPQNTEGRTGTCPPYSMAKSPIGTGNTRNAHAMNNDVGCPSSIGRGERLCSETAVPQGGVNTMAKLALYVALKAKPGKAAEVEAFLKQGAEMSKAEAGTVTWYGIKEGEGSYAVFDTFDDEAGREAHLTGAIAKALMAKADELFSNKLEIHKIQIIADK